MYYLCMSGAAEGHRARKTLVIENDKEFFHEIAEFMEALSQPQRLRILKAIEKDPKEIREIARETGMTYDNTKKHLRRLLQTGLVKREAGFSQPTSRGMLPVWKYSLVADAATVIIRNLGVFSTIQDAIADFLPASRVEEIRSSVARLITGKGTALVVISGPQEGRVFPLTSTPVALGREDEAHRLSDTDSHYLILPAFHASVTRISHPHAEVYQEEKDWFVIDKGSTSGTAVNGSAISMDTPVPLRNGDVLELGKGPTSAWIVLIILPSEPS